jgi:hypothetical protein
VEKKRVSLNDERCKELVPGGCYFFMGYREAGVNLPEITTIVYLGEETTDDEDGEAPHSLYVFQTADSYQELGDWSELPEDQKKETSSDVLVAFDTNGVSGFSDLAGLIAELQQLQQRSAQGLNWDDRLP